MLKRTDILLAGVGGQGIILASKVLARAAQMGGYDLRVSEIHGMAQRGGSVVTQVRLGEKVYSPLISEGEADVLLAFEQLEALRWLSYLRPGGTVIINNQIISPVTVLAGAAEYPQDIIGYIQKKIYDTIIVDAVNIAARCGNPKAANAVLLGILARRMPIEREFWKQALDLEINERFRTVNQDAFVAGYGL